MVEELINEYNTNQNLLLKKVDYFNLILPEYIQKQYNKITSEFTKQELDNFISEYKNLSNQMNFITAEYGEPIKDLFLMKVKELFNIPDFVKFYTKDNILDIPIFVNDEENEEFDEEIVDSLSDEISHYLLKNALVSGGAFVNQIKIFELIKDELNALQPDLFNQINKFLKYNILIILYDIPLENVGMQIQGYEQIKMEEKDDNGFAKNIIIITKGTNIIVVTHEMLKAVLDIFNEQSFLTDNIKNSIYKQRILRKICNSLYLEKWLWTFSMYMWETIVEPKYKNDKESYLKYVSTIFGKEYNGLLDFLMSK